MKYQMSGAGVFILNFEDIQDMNLVFLLLTCVSLLINRIPFVLTLLTYDSFYIHGS